MELQSTFNPSDLYPYSFQEAEPAGDEAEQWIDSLPSLRMPRTKEQNLPIAEYVINYSIWERLIKEKIDKTKPFNKIICPNLEYFASVIQFKLLRKGECLFHINDKGDNFYILFKGQLGVIKVKDQKTTKQWTCQEIVDYLSFLAKHQEYFIFNQVLKLNSQEVPFDSLNDFLKFQAIYVKTQLQAFIINMKTLDIGLLKQFLMDNNQSLTKMHINEKDLERYWNTRSIFPDEWSNYIEKMIMISGEERVFMQKFLMLTQSESITFHLIAYEHFMHINAGNYFGDFALDTPDKKRNATTISLTNSIVGLINEEYYQVYISPRRKKFKKNEMSFLHDNFFFKEIGAQTFEQKLFHFFYLQEMHSGHFLFVRNQPISEYFILRDGNVQLTLSLSLMQMRELINELSGRLIKFSNFLEKELQARLFTINKVYSQPLTFKQKLNWYQSQMQLKRTFEVFIYNKKEVIGFETHFLGFKHFFTNAKILSQEALIYTIAPNKLNPIIEDDIYSLNLYKTHGSLKAFNFIDRLDKVTEKMMMMTALRSKDLEYEGSHLKGSLSTKFSLGTKEMLKMSITSRMPEKKHKVINNKHFSDLGIQGSIMPPLLSPSSSEFRKNAHSKQKKPHYFSSSLRKSSSFVDSKVIINSKELRSSLLNKEINRFKSLSPTRRIDESTILNHSDSDWQMKGTSFYDSYYQDKKGVELNSNAVNAVVPSKIKDCTISLLHLHSDETSPLKEKGGMTIMPKIKMIRDSKREKVKKGVKLDLIKQKLFSNMIKVFDENAKRRVHKAQKTVFVFNHFCNYKREPNKSSSPKKNSND